MKSLIGCFKTTSDDHAYSEYVQETFFLHHNCKMSHEEIEDMIEYEEITPYQMEQWLIKIGYDLIDMFFNDYPDAELQSSMRYN